MAPSPSLRAQAKQSVAEQVEVWIAWSPTLLALTACGQGRNMMHCKKLLAGLIAILALALSPASAGTWK
jgi:hypothetical protein